MKLRISLLALATILIAAHFLRTSSFFLMLICVAAPFLLFVKKRWSLLTVQSLTVVAALIWLLTLYGIIQERIFVGRSWTASAIILGLVAGYTLLTGWLLNSAVVKEQYS
jgi:hypothetical protein